MAFAQSNEQEKIRQLEIQRQADKQREIDLQIDSVAQLIDTEQYEAAEAKIIYLLKKKYLKYFLLENLLSCMKLNYMNS